LALLASTGCCHVHGLWDGLREMYDQGKEALELGQQGLREAFEQVRRENAIASERRNKQLVKSFGDSWNDGMSYLKGPLDGLKQAWEAARNKARHAQQDQQSQSTVMDDSCSAALDDVARLGTELRAEVQENKRLVNLNDELLAEKGWSPGVTSEVVAETVGAMQEPHTERVEADSLIKMLEAEQLNAASLESELHAERHRVLALQSELQDARQSVARLTLDMQAEEAGRNGAAPARDSARFTIGSILCTLSAIIAIRKAVHLIGKLASEHRTFKQLSFDVERERGKVARLEEELRIELGNMMRAEEMICEPGSEFAFCVYDTEVGGSTARLIDVQCPGVDYDDIAVDIIFNGCVVRISRKADHGVAAAAWEKRFQFRLSEGLFEFKDDQAQLEKGILSLLFRPHTFEGRAFRFPAHFSLAATDRDESWIYPPSTPAGGTPTPISPIAHTSLPYNNAPTTQLTVWGDKSQDSMGAVDECFASDDVTLAPPTAISTGPVSPTVDESFENELQAGDCSWHIGSSGGSDCG